MNGWPAQTRVIKMNSVPLCAWHGHHFGLAQCHALTVSLSRLGTTLSSTSDFLFLDVR
jgi:hypothetical protein